MAVARAEVAAGGKAAVGRAVPVAAEAAGAVSVPVAAAKAVVVVPSPGAPVAAVAEAVKDPAEAEGRAVVVAEAGGPAARAVAKAVAAGDPVVPAVGAAEGKVEAAGDLAAPAEGAGVWGAVGAVWAEGAASPVVVDKVVAGRAGHQAEGIANRLTPAGAFARRHPRHRSVSAYPFLPDTITRVLPTGLNRV